MKVAACAAALVLAVATGCTGGDDGGARTTTSAASAAVISKPAAQLMTKLRCTKPAVLPAAVVGAMPASDVGCTSPAGPLEVVTFGSSAELDEFLVALRKYMRSDESVVLVKGRTWVVSYRAPDDADLSRPAVTARYREAATATRGTVGGKIVSLRG